MADNIINPVLPKTNEYFGVWLQIDSDSDAHVYVNHNEGVVIGYNESQKNLNFTNPCLVMNKDSIYLQYADDKGRPTIKNLDKKLVEDALLNMLFALAGRVKHTKTQPLSEDKDE